MGHWHGSVSLFRDTNMAALTSCEYTLYCQGDVDEKPLQGPIQMKHVEQCFWQVSANQL